MQVLSVVSLYQYCRFVIGITYWYCGKKKVSVYEDCQYISSIQYKLRLYSNTWSTETVSEGEVCKYYQLWVCISTVDLVCNTTGRKYQYIKPVSISSINLDYIVIHGILKQYLQEQYIVISEFLIMRDFCTAIYYYGASCWKWILNKTRILCSWKYRIQLFWWNRCYAMNSDIY